MRTHLLMLALIATMTAAGCKKDPANDEAKADDTAAAKAADPPAASGGADCAAVADGFMGHQRGQLEKASAEQAKQWEPVWPKAKQLFQATCEKDGWAAEVRDCFKAAGPDCSEKMTAQQRQNFRALGQQMNALVPRTEGQAETPAARVEPGDCAAAAKGYVDKAKTAVSGNAEMSKQWEPLWPKAVELITMECEKSGWSGEVVACFKAGEPVCDDKMTDAQQKGFSAMGEELAKLGKAAPAGTE